MALSTPAQRRYWRRHRRIIASFIAGRRRTLTGARVYSPPSMREQDEVRCGW